MSSTEKKLVKNMIISIMALLMIILIFNMTKSVLINKNNDIEKMIIVNKKRLDKVTKKKDKVKSEYEIVEKEKDELYNYINEVKEKLND